MKRLLPLLLIALLTVACGKEEVVSPCTAPAADQGSAKGISVSPTVTDPTPGAAVDGGSGEKPITDDTGISDDGDDLSDSERSRKKRR